MRTKMMDGSCEQPPTSRGRTAMTAVATGANRTIHDTGASMRPMSPGKFRSHRQLRAAQRNLLRYRSGRGEPHGLLSAAGKGSGVALRAVKIDARSLSGRREQTVR